MQLKVFDLGLVEYQRGLSFQKELWQQVKSVVLESALLVCRHYSVLTLGRSGSRENILVDAQALDEKGIAVYEVHRGGDVTYHGPGQLTVYPILPLAYFQRDLHLFLRYLEGFVIALLSDYGIDAQTIIGRTGVWVHDYDSVRKIASIGIAVRQWVSFHGVTLNVTKDDLQHFSLIRPCGMDIQMSSMESVLGRDMDSEVVKHHMIDIFKQSLGQRVSDALSLKMVSVD